MTHKQITIAFASISLLALAGTIMLALSRAATPTASLELESSSVSAPATIISDTSASGGKAIQFGTTTPGSFKHPGILMDKSQLDFVKSKVVAGTNPWTNGYNKFYSWSKGTAPNSSDGITYIGYPNFDYTVNCDTNAALCTSLNNAGVAAYTQALMYYYKNDRVAGQNSIKTLNAFSTHLKGVTGNQAKLQLAWTAESMVRAAEIMKHTYTPQSGETVFDTAAFSAVLKTHLVPAFVGTSEAAIFSNGNWDLSFINATMSIAVFTDDKTLFDSAVNRWSARTKAYIYLTSDGAIPVAPPGGKYDTSAKIRCLWAGYGTVTTTCDYAPGFAYVNGMIQEQCRDAGHVVMGLGSLFYAAETARIQGVDLYAQEKTRLTTGLEQFTKYYESFLASGSVTWPSSPCGRAPLGGVGAGSGFMSKLGWEVPYNAYSNPTRLNTPMPNTLKMVNRWRPSGASNQFGWETLTHAYQ